MREKMKAFCKELKTELKKVQWKKLLVIGVLMGVILGTFGHCVSIGAFALDSVIGERKFNDYLVAGSLPSLSDDMQYFNVNGEFDIGNYHCVVKQFVVLVVDSQLLSFGYVGDIYSGGELFESDFEIIVYNAFNTINGSDPWLSQEITDAFGETVTKQDLQSINITTQPQDSVISSWISLNTINSGSDLPSESSFTVDISSNGVSLGSSVTVTARGGDGVIWHHDGTWFREGVEILDSSVDAPIIITQGGGEARYALSITNMPIDSVIQIYDKYPLISSNLSFEFSSTVEGITIPRLESGKILVIKRGISESNRDIELDIYFVYDSDYKQAYDDGYSDGYDSGYGNGYAEGIMIGRTLGYDQGYQDGYSDGFNQENFVISAITDPIGALMGITLYEHDGFVLTFGGIFFTIIGVLLLVAFLRFFAGG